jgi:hypothetical protein
MDPVQKIWMFNNWIKDQEDTQELAKNHAYLLGSFSNPEAVKKMLDDGNKFESSDEDFNKSLEMVKKGVLNSKKNDKKRKRKVRI